MTDPSRSNNALIEENSLLKQRIRELEQSESKCKRVEEALQKSEEKFLELLEHINDIFYELDKRGIIQYCSPSVENLFGYSQAEIIGMSINDLLDAEDTISDIEENLQKVIVGQTATHEYRIRCKSGDIRWVRVNSNPVRKGDQIVGIRGVMSDITDRKQAEKALHESEERFRNIFEEAHLGIVTTSPSFVFEKANPEFCCMMGYSEEELHSMTFADITHPDHLNQDMENVKKVARGELPFYQTEKRYINKSGEVLWGDLIVSSIHDEHGAFRYYLSLVNDITGRKQMEEALRAKEERYRTLFSRAGDGIVLLSCDGTLVEVNESFARMHGYSTDEMLHMNLKDLNTPETFQLAPERMRRLWAGEALTFEVEHYHKDGHVFPLEVSASLISYGGESFLQSFHRDITERKQMQEELERKQTQLFLIFDQMPAEVSVLDPHTYEILFMNRCARELYGQDSTGRFCYDVFHGYKVPCQSCNNKFLLENGDESIQREVFSEPVGRYYLSTNSLIHWPDGRLAKLEISIDITERKRAEEALRESERRFRALVEQAAVGVAEIEMSTGRFYTVNHRLCEMVGMTEGELLATNFQAITHPEDIHLHEEKTALLFTGKIGYYSLEKHYVRKNGTIIFVNITVSPLWRQGEEPGRNMIVVEDITERKKTEDALRDSEERHRRLIEALSDAVLLRSKDIVIYANPAAFKLFRANHPGDLIGKRYLDLVHPDDRAISVERVKKSTDENWIAPPREHRVLALDGQTVHVESTGVPFKYRDETQVFGVFRDITERKQADEEKSRLQDQLLQSQKMESLGHLAGGVAHDLNNVLGILSGYSELLLLEIPEGHRSRVHAEKILQSTEKAAAIIQDLLALARRGVMVSSVINLNTIVSGFLQTPVLEKMKDYHPRVTFRTDYDKNLLNIKGSPVHLEKTLMNLVSNAAESISGKGEVTIRTENRYLDKAVRGYDVVKEGDYAVLTVSDTGIGIPVEDRERIFEPFYTKKTMGRSGTGLGLAIVWGTVKDHNGYVDVQTEVGQGTTFALYFPVTREEQIVQQQKILIERYMGKGESVLVVDDIAEQRDVAAGLLTRLGYKVHSISSGEEALEYLKTHKADLLLLDMIMTPGIDGLETYQRVLEINPKQKAILVSGFSETQRVRKAQELGAGAYVKKPYLMEKIGVAVRKELDRK